MSNISLHPLLNDGLTLGSGTFAGGTLVCHCADKPVKVSVGSDALHNHACGCTKCWKPDGAIFSIVGVVPKHTISVLENGDKLAIVEEAATIQRYACTGCGVHLFGRIEKAHAFHGLDFIHAELFEEQGAAAPGFAAFVSSAIEGGVDPVEMDGIRARFKDIGLEPYDCLNPPLMDALATFAAKQNA
ncbi:S-(hydroxymethyl)glutathione synthase [Sphingobium boeckii]|uniref:Glutathione-dependent formaldehyde-activating enzyme n=1 Tax=Sphingobium boeckii TaxID=1082345 RepID=A0A7W9EEJ5_9SPHN|nr:S-(hydroxymethyl)glutathione synthase [Sphingobium boeckii]MBB5686328.1 S-(hydroxymethyl)glutathione synthase [Sphingobium boeckii]